jgi:hypothetical protein
LILPAIAMAANKTVTLFSDGAVIETELTAHKGVAEIRLPGEMVDGTLRITPLNGTAIRRVDILADRPGATFTKQSDGLLERRNRLQDRLQALATREEIFRAAARSQSAKAPRKTKANPDPMQSIRQGTDFAIAQLEAVYTAKRKAEQEIARIEKSLAAQKKGAAGAEKAARVFLTTANGRVKVRYALAGNGWTPRYDLHLNGNGQASLTLYGRLPDAFDNAILYASPGKMSGTAGVSQVPAGAALARLAAYQLPSSDERFGDGLISSFSCILANPGPLDLAAGEAALYRNGEYRGQLRFEGISSGRSRRVSYGL